MTPLVLNFEEVRALLKQRFPMLMIDRVVALELGESITAVKNITGNEPQFLGHFPERAIMPGTLIVEAIGQAACILFSRMTGAGLAPGEFLVLGAINNMRFLVPVTPGDQMEIRVRILKRLEDIALVQGEVTVAGVMVATGTLGFGRRTL